MSCFQVQPVLSVQQEGAGNTLRKPQTADPFLLEQVFFRPRNLFVRAPESFLAAWGMPRGPELGELLVFGGLKTRSGRTRSWQIPGKFINMGNKKEEYEQFCIKFAGYMSSEDDWWGMLAWRSVAHGPGNPHETLVVMGACWFQLTSAGGLCVF